MDMASVDIYLEKYKNDMIRFASDLIKIKSVKGKITEFNKPFGKGINNALLRSLREGSKLGFKVKNIDG